MPVERQIKQSRPKTTTAFVEYETELNNIIPDEGSVIWVRELQQMYKGVGDDWVPVAGTAESGYTYQFTVGNLANIWGYLTGVFGDITPNHFAQTEIEGLNVTDTNDLVNIAFVGSVQIEDFTELFLDFEGYTGEPVKCTWNGSSYTVTDATFTAWLVGQNGNTLGMNIAKGFQLTVGTASNAYGFGELLFGGFGDLAPKFVQGEKVDVWWFGFGSIASIEFVSSVQLEGVEKIIVYYEGYGANPVEHNWNGSGYAADDPAPIGTYIQSQNGNTLSCAWILTGQQRTG